MCVWTWGGAGECWVVGRDAVGRTAFESAAPARAPGLPSSDRGIGTAAHRPDLSGTPPNQPFPKTGDRASHSAPYTVPSSV